MDENKNRLNDQELSVEELEAIFSGPSLADSLDSEVDREELARLVQNVLKKTEPKSESSLPSSLSSTESTTAAEPKNKPTAAAEVNAQNSATSSSIQNKQLGSSLSSQLNLMASGAADIAARRTSESEYEVSTFAAVPEKKAEIQAVSLAQKQDDEVAGPEPDSPEALRERIKAYQESPKEKNLMAQSLGIVFSFGFTVAAVILAFWWLGQRAVEYSGLAWLAYPFIIFGVLLGLYSGALVLKPFLKGALPVVPLAKKGKTQNVSQSISNTESNKSELMSTNDNESKD